VCAYGVSSSFASFSCPHVGEYGEHEECKNWCVGNIRERCQSIHSASRAPLCQLPQYVAHYEASVRQAASARFIELQEAAAKWQKLRSLMKGKEE